MSRDFLAQKIELLHSYQQKQKNFCTFPSSGNFAENFFDPCSPAVHKSCDSLLCGGTQKALHQRRHRRGSSGGKEFVAVGVPADAVGGGVVHPGGALELGGAEDGGSVQRFEQGFALCRMGQNQGDTLLRL